ncbi:hypothetical protein D3C85_527470 [compost metagenome]
MKQPIEMQFLNSWEGWDEHGVLAIQFYGCSLKPQVFGTTVAEDYEACDVFFDGESGCVSLSKDGMPELAYRMNINLTLEDSE